MRVAVMGVGAVAPPGIGADALWQALADGYRGVRPREDGTVAATVAPAMLRPAAQLHRGLTRLPHVTQMLCLAAAEALKARVLVGAGPPAAGMPAANSGDETAGIVVGTCYANLNPIFRFYEGCKIAGPAGASPAAFPDTVLNAAAGHVAIMLGLRGPTTTLSSGHLSGTLALRHAADMVWTEQARRIIACGADELPPPRVVEALRPFLVAAGEPAPGSFAVCRGRYALGEGAGALVLERGPSADAMAEIHGISFVASGHCKEATVTAALTQALAAAHCSPSDVAGGVLSVNGDPDVDRPQLAAVNDVFRVRRDPIPCTAIKATLGECLGAYGLLAAVVAVYAVRTRTLPPTADVEEHAQALCGKARLAAAPQELPTGVVACVDTGPYGACAVIVSPAGKS